jgi:hypothetical protein
VGSSEVEPKTKAASCSSTSHLTRTDSSVTTPSSPLSISPLPPLAAIEIALLSISPSTLARSPVVMAQDILEILPVEPEDFARLSDIEAAAFDSSPITTALFSQVSPSNRRSHALKRDPQKRLIKTVRDGKIVGWAQWEVPLKEGEKPFEPAREERPGWAEGTNVEEAEAFFAKLDLGIKEPHYRASFFSSFHFPSRLNEPSFRPQTSPSSS